MSNCPGKNAIAVAELAFGLILSLDRRIPDNVAELRAGSWNKKEYSKAQGLYGRTLALLGVGSIGQEMIRRAAGFGMNVVIWSRRFDGADRARSPISRRARWASRACCASIAIELAPTPADAVSRGRRRQRPRRAQPGDEGAGRRGAAGEDEAGRDLHQHRARRSRGLRGAGGGGQRPRAARRPRRLRQRAGDARPRRSRDPLVELPGVYGTHHIGASTDQAQEAIAAETVRIIRSYKETGRVPNVVNLARRTPATHMLVVRHRDRPGVLAHVFNHLRQANLNVQETENIVFEGAEAAVARINLDGEPPAGALSQIKSREPDVLDLQLVTL